MRWFAIFVLAVSSVLGGEATGPFYNPITGFSEAFLPILDGFEKAKVETTLRGFFVRADASPAFSRSELEPSESGLYLNVAVRDADEVKGFSDRSEQKGAVIHRLVQIPPPKGGEQAIVIELDYGRDVSAAIIQAIDKCIGGVVRFSRKSSKQ